MISMKRPEVHKIKKAADIINQRCRIYEECKPAMHSSLSNQLIALEYMRDALYTLIYEASQYATALELSNNRVGTQKCLRLYHIYFLDFTMKNSELSRARVRANNMEEAKQQVEADHPESYRFLYGRCVE